MGVLLLDTFSDANGTNPLATTRQSDSGHQMILDGASDVRSVTGGKLTKSSGQQGVVYNVGESDDLDITVKFDFAGGSDCGIKFREVDYLNFLLCYVNSATGDLVFYDKIAGTFTARLLVAGPVYGPSVVIRVSIRGNVFTFYKDDVFILTYTTAQFAGNTKIGLYQGVENTTQFDFIEIRHPRGRFGEPAGPSLLTQMRQDSPAALHLLDEASGTVGSDLSGNGRDLTYTANGARRGLANPVPGGTNVFWGGATTAYGYAVRATEAGLLPGTSDFLFTFWYRGGVPNGGATNNFDCPFSLDNNATGNGIDVYVVGVNGAGIPQGVVRCWCGGTVMNGVKVVTDSLPHHIWIERRSGTLSFIIDGVLDVSASRPATATVTGSRYAIGTPDNASSPAPDYHWFNAYSYMAYWVGTIPAQARAKAHYEAGVRSGVVLG